MKNKEWKIYTLRSTFDKRVRYIGCTCLSLNVRLLAHRGKARHEAWPSPVHRWMRGVYDAGGSIEIRAVEVHASAKGAHEAERNRIGRTRGIYNTRWRGDYQQAIYSPPWNESPAFRPGDRFCPPGHTARLASVESILSGSPRNTPPTP